MAGIFSTVSELGGCVVITGCSGGGKSTLLDELSRRGYATVPEPGRRIVQEELAADGKALPWVDLAAFGRRALAMASQDLELAKGRSGWVFFDRGVVDAASALSAAEAKPVEALLPPASPYHETVFIAPPWAEIYRPDSERRHGFAEALEEYVRLTRVYPAYGHKLIELPKVSVARRADFVLTCLGSA